MKFLVSDLFNKIKKLRGYFFWNIKGVRVSPNSYVSLKAKLNKCAIFGNSTVLDEAVIGEKTYMTNAYIQHATIGSYCSLGPGCKIGLEEHDINNFSTHPLTYNSKEFNSKISCSVIGEHVWIGANVLVLKGVKIGDHAVVAGGAVVTKDIPEYEVWGGVPAKFIKKRIKK